MVGLIRARPAPAARDQPVAVPRRRRRSPSLIGAARTTRARSASCAATPDAYWQVAGRCISKTDTLYLATFTRAGGLLLGAAFAMVWRPVALMRGPLRDKGRLLDLVALARPGGLGVLCWCLHIVTRRRRRPVAVPRRLLRRSAIATLPSSPPSPTDALVGRAAARQRRCSCGSAPARTGCTCSTGRSTRSSAASPATRCRSPQFVVGDGRRRSYHRAVVPVPRDADPHGPRRALVAPPAGGARPGAAPGRSPAVGGGARRRVGVRRRPTWRPPSSSRTRSPQSLDRGREGACTTARRTLLDRRRRPPTRRRRPATTVPAADQADRSDRAGGGRRRRRPPSPATDHGRRRRPSPPTDDAAAAARRPDPRHRRLGDARRRGRAGGRGHRRRRRGQPADEDDGARSCSSSRDSGQLGDAVVVHLGTNGPSATRRSTEFFSALADVPKVVVLTVARRPGAGSPATTPSCMALPAQFPNVTVLVLGGARPTQCPGDCFYDDGIHLNQEGQDYYADADRRACSASSLTVGDRHVGRIRPGERPRYARRP